MRRRALLAIGGLLLAACSDAERGEAPAPRDGEAEDSRPNLVVVCIDTLRADHCSLYGYARPTTPCLEALAAEGFVARHYFANAPWTKPSVASSFTGLPPSAHGSRLGLFGAKVEAERLIEVLSDRHRTLAEALGEGGYRTAAYTTNVNMAPKFGYAQGFDDYAFVPHREQSMVELDAQGVEFTRDMLAEREQDGAPRFVWLHLMSVHQYESPAEDRPFRSEGSTPIPREARQAHRVARYPDLEAAIDDYDHSIRYADALVGRLHEALRGLDAGTVLVVLADHGEEFLDHGGFEHGATLFREQLAVPFVAAGPGVPRAELRGLADSLDLAPTLCRLAGASAAGFPGQALFDAEGPGAGKAQSFAEQHHRTPQRRFSLQEGDRKLIVEVDRRSGEESYRVVLDALEGEQLLAPRHVEVERLAPLRQRLRAEQEKAEATFRERVGEIETTTVSDGDLERLRALGYARRETDGDRP